MRSPKAAIEKLTMAELDAVMAHELAHVANNDMARMTYIRGVQNALTWFLIFRGMKNIALWLFTPTSQLELMRFSRQRGVLGRCGRRRPHQSAGDCRGTGGHPQGQGRTAQATARLRQLHATGQCP